MIMSARVLKTANNDKIDLIIPDQNPSQFSVPKFWQTHRRQSIKYSVIFVLLMIILIILWTILPIILNPTKEDTEIVILKGHHKLIEKYHWQGTPAANSSFLQVPADLVIISHTATRFCQTQESCSELVSSIQGYHVGKQFGDIAYNFLIGGDGNIYVGRGWDVINHHRDKSIAICFIGNFVNDELSSEMIEAAQELLKRGVQLKKLTQRYRVVCHNQTANTLSPGGNVYKVVKLWEHFLPEKLY